MPPEAAAPPDPTLTAPPAPAAPLAPPDPVVAAPVAPAAPAPSAPAAPELSVAPPAPDLKVEPGPLERFDAEKAAREAEVKAKSEAPKAPDAPEAPKASEAPKTEDAPKVEAVAPVEWKFTLPETLKVDDKQMTKFTGILDGLRAPKEGESPAAYGQQLLDLHNEAMTEFASQTVANQFKVFNETRAAQEKRQMADPEFGGSAYPVAIATCARVRDALISSERPGTTSFNKVKYESDVREFNEMLQATGASSWPAFMRLLHNAAAYVDEPQASEAPTNIKPPKGNGKAPRGNLYTHPSSQNMET